MNLKTPDEIKRMREAGLLLWQTHELIRSLLAPGITTFELNREAENFIYAHNAVPLFKGVPGKVPFPAGVCASLNEEVVHGIPSERKLQNGDIISIDIGVKLGGWCADAAVTCPVGTPVDEKDLHLLKVTEECLRMDITLLPQKSKWSKVVKHSYKYVRDAGFSVIDELAGHAIGTQLWESPQVPNFIPAPAADFKLRPGLVIAIEPMIAAGSRTMKLLDDGWTYVTKDGSRSAHFEHTVALTEHGTVVLTCGPNGEGWAV
ncbi:MAG: type I methionyl aminopeptidase [Chitinispirillaceae bacterium]|nr:type I methionyl aminopeptidase [Chitinispirillaceae bacterium]